MQTGSSVVGKTQKGSGDGRRGRSVAYDGRGGATLMGWGEFESDVAESGSVPSLTATTTTVAAAAM